MNAVRRDGRSIGLGFLTGAAAWLLAAAVDGLPSAVGRDAIVLAYPILAGSVVGLVGATVKAVLGVWIGTQTAWLVSVWATPLQLPTQGDFGVAAAWTAAVAVMAMVGFGLGRIARALLAWAGRPLIELGRHRSDVRHR